MRACVRCYEKLGEKLDGSFDESLMTGSTCSADGQSFVGSEDENHNQENLVSRT